MKAIIVEEKALVLRNVAPPTLLPNHVRISVHATAVNRADLLQRAGLYPPPQGVSEILGLECAGEVNAVGEGVEGLKEGDCVMALLAGGGYAEEVVVHVGTVIPMPKHFSFEQAAAFPETFITAYFNLFMLGAAQAGEWILVHGGAGGVGTAAIALCKETQVQIAVTCRGGIKKARCEFLGAHLAIDYQQEDFVQVIAEKIKNVDVVLDCLGASLLEKNLQVLSRYGRLLLIGLMGGSQASLDLKPLLTKCLQISGSTLRGQSLSQKALIVENFRERFGEALNAGRLQPVIHAVLPLEQAEDAHAMMRNSEHIGKIVLKITQITTATNAAYL
jgi:tumor protein p53-inducible protein 3